MTRIEQLECELAALSQRLAKVEANQKKLLGSSKDHRLAVEFAEAHDFDPTILFLPDHLRERIALARSLKRSGWTQSRIAKVFNVCERTAERWTARVSGRGGR